MYIVYMYFFLMKCIVVDVRLLVLFMINYYRYIILSEYRNASES